MKTASEAVAAEVANYLDRNRMEAGVMLSAGTPFHQVYGHLVAAMQSAAADLRRESNPILRELELLEAGEARRRAERRAS